MREQYVDVEQLVNFVERTVKHGVPLRVAYDRAAKRFGVDRSWVKSWHTSVAR